MSNLMISGMEYVNLVSAESELIEDSGKPKIRGVYDGSLVTFVEEPFGQENKGLVYEVGKSGVFVDDGSGIEKYCAFKLRPISSNLTGFALVHKTNRNNDY